MGKSLTNYASAYDVYGLVTSAIHGGLTYYVKPFNIREGYIWIKYKKNIVYSLLFHYLLRNPINKKNAYFVVLLPLKFRRGKGWSLFTALEPLSLFQLITAKCLLWSIAFKCVQIKGHTHFIEDTRQNIRIQASKERPQTICFSEQRIL